MSASILDQIIARKRQEVAERRRMRPEKVLQTQLEAAPPIRDFLERLAEPGPIKLIAEIKKASPSRGVIRAHFHPAQLALCYQSHGAAAISVLTDETFFQGSLTHLEEVRRACQLPLLRKDFVIDRYQLLEARLAGADAVLLIAECLDDCQLRSLLQDAVALNLTPLVEFHEAENLQRVLDAGAQLVGINNRNLRTFEVTIEHTLRLRDRIPDHVIVVSESGIQSPEDVQRLASAGVHALLIGEQLMKAPDPGQAILHLLGKTH
jgi:indole-3-glycerol phosphate synthase